MDRALNPSQDKDTIYMIYRGCRLCGGGAGYKMPIVQNIVDLEANEVPLSQKIRECVQIEVNEEDKMPPLICELCVDKVNDYYEFMELCHQTNKRTRSRLGLPLQASSAVGVDSSNGCILGAMEPICIDNDSDSDVEPLSKQINVKPKDQPIRNFKKATSKSVTISATNKPIKSTAKDAAGPASRTSSINNRQNTIDSPTLKNNATGARVTRLSNNFPQSKVDPPPKETVDKSKSSGKLKPILKKVLEKVVVIKIEDDTSFFKNRKRTQISDEKHNNSVVPSKKVRLADAATSQTYSQKTKLSVTEKSSPSSKSKKDTKKDLEIGVQKKKRMSQSPTLEIKDSPQSDILLCKICYQTFRTSIRYNNHLKVHVPTYTSSKLACNPCREWFSTSNDALVHQRHHTTKLLSYKCQRCSAEYDSIGLYDAHFEKDCIPYDEVPDVKCEICWKCFPTSNLFVIHDCAGIMARHGGQCRKCNRKYILLKNLEKHEKFCSYKVKGSEPVVEPGVMEQLKTVQILLVRCDAMVNNGDRRWLSSEQGSLYGSYGYITSVRSIKSEPIDDFDSIVGDINKKIKQEFTDDDDIIDWDSDVDNSNSTVIKRHKVDTLAALALKAIASQRFLGKVAKKYRKIKVEKMFDSLGGFGVKNVNKLLKRLDGDDSGKDAEKTLKKIDYNKEISDATVGDKVSNSESVEEKCIRYNKTNSSEKSVELSEGKLNSVPNDLPDSSHGICNDSVELSHETKSNDETAKESNNLLGLNHEINTNDGNKSVSNDSVESSHDKRLNDDPKPVNNSADLKNDKNIQSIDVKYKKTNNTNGNVIERNNDSEIGNIDDKTDSRHNDAFENINNTQTKNNETSGNTVSHDSNGDTEYKRLMKELNKQIGDGKNQEKGDQGPTFDQNDNVGDLDQPENGVGIEDKIQLDGLIVNKDIDKSMDLDSISDEEFDFDV